MVCHPPYEICENCEHIETYSDSQHDLLKIKSNSHFENIPKV